MRTLRNNPRKFQEPFVFQKIKEDDSSGMSVLTIENETTIFGSIMNTDQMRVSGNTETGLNSLSIKIVKQYFHFKIKDRIIYNNGVYSITSIQNDNYSATEMVILCKYEKEFRSAMTRNLELMLQGVLYGN